MPDCQLPGIILDNDRGVGGESLSLRIGYAKAVLVAVTGPQKNRAPAENISDFGDALCALCALCVHFSVLGHRVATASFMLNGAR
jgi:hypothetical protein